MLHFYMLTFPPRRCLLSPNFLDLGNSTVPWAENQIEMGAGTLCGDRGQAFRTPISGEDQQRQHGCPRTQ